VIPTKSDRTRPDRPQPLIRRGQRHRRPPTFVRTPADIEDLLHELDTLADHHTGILIKIETAAAFRHLPELLLTAMRRPRIGVMIARGDLAVECGYERLAELQEEILWICEAAHLPVVWATQVLEQLAKTGRPTRAEVTDAAMSDRAECVMPTRARPSTKPSPSSTTSCAACATTSTRRSRSCTRSRPSSATPQTHRPHPERGTHAARPGASCLHTRVARERGTVPAGPPTAAVRSRARVVAEEGASRHGVPHPVSQPMLRREDNRAHTAGRSCWARQARSASAACIRP